jgi:hypothetical protein
MATLVELKARAKKMGYKGYSKLKKGELEKLLTTPPPKPPRTKPVSQRVPIKQVQPAKKAPTPVKTLSGGVSKAVDYIMKELRGRKGFSDFSVDGDVGRVVMNLSPNLMSAKNGRLRYTSKGDDVAENMAFMNDKQKAKMRAEVENILQQNKVKAGSPYDQFLTTPNRSRFEELLKANGLPFVGGLGDDIAADPSIRSKFLNKTPTPFSQIIKKLSKYIEGIKSETGFDLETAKEDIANIKYGYGLDGKVRGYRSSLLEGKKRTDKQIAAADKKRDIVFKKALDDFYKQEKKRRTSRQGWLSLWNEFLKDFNINKYLPKKRK